MAERPLPDDTGALQAEIVRLNKVVRALINRAERESAGRSSHFGLLQDTVMLENKVRRRTTELEAALHENERINRDLTREREEQRVLIRKLEEAHNQLLQSEKLASIGQLAAGVAHEINNPIGFVNSNLGTLSRYFGDLKAVIDAYRSGDAGRIAAAVEAADLEFLLDDARDLLDESLDGLGRVKKIVQDLRDFSRVDRGGREPTDLNAALASTLRVAAGQLGAGTEIVTEFGELPPVVCDAARINQVFLNLLLNAAQAIAGQGRITVRSGRDDDGVWVSVEDTGCGIAPEIRDHIFEPFFTTRPVGQGTGLGLSTCHDIVVKEHGGRIDVDSQPGRGSVFRVRLPLTAG